MYVLVDKKQLEAKGIFPFAETIPDGRAIIPFKALKSISGLMNIDIVSAEQLKELQAVRINHEAENEECSTTENQTTEVMDTQDINNDGNLDSSDTETKNEKNAGN